MKRTSRAVPPPSSEPLRFGLVDMGSNAIRVQVSEVVPGSDTVRTLESHRAAVRLGHDVFLTGTVPEQVLEAAVEVLARFRETCDRLGVHSIHAIATSAMRDARNRREVVERIRAATGIEIQVISGSEEAWLLTTAVRSKVDLSQGRSLLVDLGGGSVEVGLLDAGEVVHSESYRLGALRVLQALRESEPSGGDGSSDYLRLLDEYVRAVEGRIVDEFGDARIDRYVATGGNVDSIADLLGKEGKVTQVDGVDACQLADLEDLTRRLAVLSYAERVERFGLRPDRADTILPAAVVYYRLGRCARADTVLVPRVGMRDGLLQDVVDEYLRQTQAHDQRHAILNAARALGRRYHYDAGHAETVRRLAVRLFDATAEIHGLDETDRTLLECAAILHDIGVFVSNAKHHKHSWYLIRASDLVGLSVADREVVALVARYHRRAHPAARHFGWSGLTVENQLRVGRLAGLLRLADSLDRGHQGKIADLEIEVTRKSLDLRPVLADGVRSDLMLETLGVQEKGGLFREMFGRPVHLHTP